MLVGWWIDKKDCLDCQDDKTDEWLAEGSYEILGRDLFQDENRSFRFLDGGSIDGLIQETLRAHFARCS